ncbi:MAG TPA: SpoIIE family protein phosphatase [Bryobacteraceae bacterium]|nr:SpoIIE family protein phosphatase [Bryobacteraceae bacterium]
MRHAEELLLLDYGASSLTTPGEQESGDAYLVSTTPGGALLAVVDGAGHGAEAALAARLAVATLEAHRHEGVLPLFRRCHERLKGTRGVVMSLVSLDGIENSITWLGVGNVEGVLLRSGESADSRWETMFLRPGVVGYRLPSLQAIVTPIAPGDLVILTTDGIRADFTRHFGAEDSPEKIAGYISSNFRKGDDDGLVLVARYLGSRA